MVNLRILNDLKNTSIEEFSKNLKQVLLNTTREEFIKITGVDKNVLYRALTGQNITLENYFKIKKHLPNTNPMVGSVPLQGQIVDEVSVRVLDMSQPQTVSVPTPMINHWSPIFGYLYSSQNLYNNFCALFSTKHIDSSKLNRKIDNRLVMAYPEGQSPIYGMGFVTDKKIKILGVYDKKVRFECSLENNINWARLINFVPLSLMEYHEPTNDAQEQSMKVIAKEDKKFGDYINSKKVY